MWRFIPGRFFCSGDQGPSLLPVDKRKYPTLAIAGPGCGQAGYHRVDGQ